MSKVEEILEKLVYADIEIEKHFLIDKMIEKAKSELRKVIEECVPEKEIMLDNYARGFRTCRTQTLKNLAEVFEEEERC